jgi:hypothetical protein
MTKYARIENNIVVELFEEKPNFHPDVMRNIGPVPDSTKAGMSKVGSNRFEYPAPSKESLKKTLKDYRLSVEEGGFQLGEMFIESDEKSERRIIGAWAKAKADSTYEVTDWKVGENFITLNAASLILIGDALDTHFQKCFKIENQVIDLIDNGTLTTEEEVTNKFDELF